MRQWILLELQRPLDSEQSVDMSRQDLWLRLFNSQFFDEHLALRYAGTTFKEAFVNGTVAMCCTTHVHALNSLSPSYGC